ncbi:unnamed protein product [Boreogadus saida]
MTVLNYPQLNQENHILPSGYALERWTALWLVDATDCQSHAGEDAPICGVPPKGQTDGQKHKMLTQTPPSRPTTAMRYQNPVSISSY